MKSRNPTTNSSFTKRCRIIGDAFRGIDCLESRAPLICDRCASRRGCGACFRCKSNLEGFKRCESFCRLFARSERWAGAPNDSKALPTYQQDLVHRAPPLFWGSAGGSVPLRFPPAGKALSVHVPCPNLRPSAFPALFIPRGPETVRESSKPGRATPDANGCKRPSNCLQACRISNTPPLS
jgi:hypothetical protein